MTSRTAEDGAIAIRRWFDAAIAAVDPANAVTAGLRRDGRALKLRDVAVPVPGRLFVLSVGKAAQGMAFGACAACGDLIDQGFIITKDGHLDGGLPVRFDARVASHPIPDERGIAATEALLSTVGRYGAGDVVLALISGGGSALMEAPIAGVTLADVAATTSLLLRAGAPIHDLNAVRVPLSRVKGGGLRRAAPKARFVTLLLSDVLGNDPRVIASGPTVPTIFTSMGALQVLQQYGISESVPASVLTALTADAVALDDRPFADDVVQVVGDNALALDAFAREAEREGARAQITWRSKQGEAREIGRDWVAMLPEIDAEIDLVLGGGEATVTVTGTGTGGRNTEFALAAGLELERHGLHDWMVASLATDGEDALTGVAGAVVTAAAIGAARARGVGPEAALAANDSLAVFRAVDGCVEPGPTGTNVNDLYVALRIAPSPPVYRR